MNDGTSTIPRILGTPAEVTIGAASAQSSSLTLIADGNSANCFRLCSTVDCRVLIGNNPTALATSVLLAAGCPEYFRANPLEEVAVIQESIAGKLSVAACNVI